MSKWTGKRWAALILAIVIAGGGISAAMAGASLKLIMGLFIGAALGLAYVVLGYIPEPVMRLFNLNEDDDPSGLPRGLVYSVLGALALLVIVFFVGLLQGWWP